MRSSRLSPLELAVLSESVSYIDGVCECSRCEKVKNPLRFKINDTLAPVVKKITPTHGFFSLLFKFLKASYNNKQTFLSKVIDALDFYEAGSTSLLEGFLSTRFTHRQYESDHTLLYYIMHNNGDGFNQVDRKKVFLFLVDQIRQRRKGRFFVGDLWTLLDFPKVYTSLGEDAIAAYVTCEFEDYINGASYLDEWMIDADILSRDVIGKMLREFDSLKFCLPDEGRKMLQRKRLQFTRVLSPRNKKKQQEDALSDECLLSDTKIDEIVRLIGDVTTKPASDVGTKMKKNPRRRRKNQKLRAKKKKLKENNTIKNKEGVGAAQKKGEAKESKQKQCSGVAASMLSGSQSSALGSQAGNDLPFTDTRAGHFLDLSSSESESDWVSVSPRNRKKKTQPQRSSSVKTPVRKKVNSAQVKRDKPKNSQHMKTTKKCKNTQSVKPDTHRIRQGGNQANSTNGKEPFSFFTAHGKWALFSKPKPSSELRWGSDEGQIKKGDRDESITTPWSYYLDISRDFSGRGNR